MLFAIVSRSGPFQAKGWTPADRCLTVAAFYERHRLRPEIDPEDRYYFKTHAPVIDEVSPGVRRYHEHLMDHLRKRLDQLMAG